MWPFRRKNKEEPRASKTMRKVLIGFVIGSAITSIIGKNLMREHRRKHLGEDNQE